MSDLKWTPVTIRLGQVKPWNENPRMSTKAQAERLIQSERELGQVQTIAIGPADEAGFFPLYDGHQRYSAWYTVKGASYELIALQSNRPLTEDERRKMSILLHTASGGWDWEKMASWQVGELKEWGLVNQENVKGWNNDANNVKEILKAEQSESVDAEPQIDRAAELLEKWQVKTGDLWQIGEHRLICGDCTDAAVVARVMGGEKADMVFEDPPYNVASEGRNYAADAPTQKKTYEALKNSEWDKDFDIQPHLEILLEFMAEDCAVYICTSQWLVQQIWEWMWEWSKFCFYCVWCKPNPAPSLAKRHWNFSTELIPYAVRGKHIANYPASGHALSWWEIVSPSHSEPHPTQKPVEIPSRAISFSSLDNHLILDCFSGSGTTLVACQNLSRRGRAIEISPAYCAVTLQRMADAFPELEIRRL